MIVSYNVIESDYLSKKIKKLYKKNKKGKRLVNILKMLKKVCG